jgi:N-methylhydantoinase A/oxoprolinase/acetone carboxylase beta subunit
MEPFMIIGLDVGGTHTDVVLLDNTRTVKKIKVPTNHSDLFQTVLDGLEKITEGISLEDIKRLVLSTTLTTNAIVQNKIPPVGMIVSSGPGLDPKLFKTGDHYFSVGGSIDHRGREVEKINREEIQRIADYFNQYGVRYAGVVGKFSVRNPSHEKAICRILEKRLDVVFLGHRMSGKLNFPRRIATTFLNASVYPIHKAFFEAVNKSLSEKGLRVPIHILKADGGTMNFESSIRVPGQTILSGPSASVMGAIPYAGKGEECLVLDIGGTTTDIAVLINQSPVLDPLGIGLNHFKTLIRSLETRSIGIGGDSVIRIENGKPVIGPDRLGPAMAYGGTSPTPTDAIVALGMVPDLDPEASIKGMKQLSESIGKTLRETAFHVFDQTCREIFSHARQMIGHINAKPVYTVHEVWENHTVTPKKVLVLGGPAPFFASHLETVSGIKTEAVADCSVANAVGAALARTTCEVTLFADTEQGIATAPEEAYSEKIGPAFSKSDAISITRDLLKAKAVRRGAFTDDLEMEILEDLEFNMVRGFSTSGKNMRIKMQVKPGLIHGFDL